MNRTEIRLIICELKKARDRKEEETIKYFNRLNEKIKKRSVWK